MPARDAYHDAVRRALEKDGWRITHDPLHLRLAGRDMFVDLGAEMIAAEQGDKRIAVEVKGFDGRSELTELERALGQFMLYEFALSQRDPGRFLYLAVPDAVLVSLFEDDLGKPLIEAKGIRVFGFDIETAEVTKWLPKPP